jgi:hypothetical protein
MSLLAAKIDVWYLDDLDTAVNVFPVRSGGTSVYKKREHYILTLSRKFAGMLAFFEEVGTTRSSFTARTSAGSTWNYSSTGRRWMCTKDNPKIIDSITGEGVQTQVWEHWTDEEDLPESQYP